jgi:N-acetylglutamate synthase-like GNAT family acetyltransferase
MPGIQIAPLTLLPESLARLEAESITEGFSMVSRLRTEWEVGLNRFDKAGEILLGAFRGADLVGTGGLNIDPYLADPTVGRIRHVYVLAADRRTGTGRAIVERLLAHASDHFDIVRLWTGRASSFYDRLGFMPTSADKATHVWALGGGAAE